MPFQPNENISGALRASLRLLTETENAQAARAAQAQGSIVEDSPLSEVAADAIERELNYINDELSQGHPEKLLDRIPSLVDLFRAQALRWEQEQAAKPARAPRGSAKPTRVAKPLLDL